MFAKPIKTITDLGLAISMDIDPTFNARIYMHAQGFGYVAYPKGAEPAQGATEYLSYHGWTKGPEIRGALHGKSRATTVADAIRNKLDAMNL